MSRSLVQPIGQKRLTNVAVVRLKKHGLRFEIACYKNKVLQSQTVYSNVSKGVLAKSKDLNAAFGTTTKRRFASRSIMEKGELQVAGKERDSQLSNQFRDIATIVMEKTINPQTQRPYPISMIERLMHEIHFAVDPHQNSKKQALELIRELQKHFPIKRSPMRLRLIIPEGSISPLMEKLSTWGANVISKDESGSQLCVVCEIEPGFFRDCDSFVRSIPGWGETRVDQHEEADELLSLSTKAVSNSVAQLGERMQRQNISEEGRGGEEQAKKNRCGTCDAAFGDAREYRDHFKTDWHKHNLRRKECLADMESDDYKSDLNNYSF
ncbi:unnamed protein product [Spirodela intermedia]|uniref:C2H2-type domain-containing protein n=1 Tax=Spirodela intermedia TaxID=51605 RepID=A0A7I8JE62_SPIIN|nr:unnamed protein product [Spirodela intermedia]CAA6668444.1 unnamed protein product [Spirodela intermedia]